MTSDVHDSTGQQGIMRADAMNGLVWTELDVHDVSRVVMLIGDLCACQ